MADKRKKAAYFSKCGAKRSRTQFTLHPGLKGFLATCNFREKDCVREAINILNEFADKIYGEDKSSNLDQPKNKKIVFKDSDSENEGEDDDNIESALAREVTALKEERQGNPNRRRFQVLQSGAENCVFIRTTVEDPVAVVEAILKEIESQSKQRTRFLLRLLPIEATCKAWPDDIKKASEPLFDKYFKGEPKTFSVVYKRRNNNNVLREELIHDIASDIKSRNPLHRADMKQPDLAVIVEVIRNMCLMSVVPKYFHYRKYNLLEVAKINVASSMPLESKDQIAETMSTQDSVESQEKHCQASSIVNEEKQLETELGTQNPFDADVSTPAIKTNSDADVSTPAIKSDSDADVSTPAIKSDSDANVATPAIKSDSDADVSTPAIKSDSEETENIAV